MAEFVLYIATSLDGFIATPGGSVAWLKPFEAEDYGYDSFAAAIDIVVCGRVTYEQVIGFGAWPYAGKPCLVLTSGPLRGSVPDKVEAWRLGTQRLIAGLRRTPGRVWIVGGARTIHAFLMAGAVDEIHLFTMPLMLGNGIRLFPPGPPERPLRLRESRAWANGCVSSVYDVTG